MVSKDSGLTLKLLDTQIPVSKPQPKDFELLRRELIEIKGDLKSHSGPILCFAISSDNQFLLSGSTDKSIILWDLKDMKLVQTLKSHTADVTSLSLNQDNSSFLSSSADFTVKLWDFKTRSLLRTLTGHSEKVNSAIFISPDQILSCSDDKLIKLWTIDGISVRNIEIHSEAVNVIRISSDFKNLISASVDKTVKITDLGNQTEKTSRVLESFDESVTCLEIDNVFLICSAGVSIKVMNVQDWTVKCHFLDSKGVKALKIADNSKLLLTCSDAFYMIIWDLTLEQKVYGLTYYPNTTLAICVTSDFQKILTGLSDKTIKVFNTVSRKDYSTFLGHQAEVNMVKVSSCGNYLVSASSDSTVKVWDIEKKIQIMMFGLPEVLCIALAPKNNFVIAGYSDSLIKVWNAERAELVSTISLHQAKVTCIAVDMNSQLVASASVDQMIKIWSFSSEELLISLNYHSGKISSLVFLNNFLLTSSSDGSVVLWDTLSDTPSSVVVKMESPVVSTCKSKSESLFAACSQRGEVEVWDWTSKSSIFSKNLAKVLVSVKLLESKKLVFNATQNNSIIVSNFATGSEVYLLKTSSLIHSIELSPDESNLLVGMQDSKIQMFSLQSQKSSKVFEGHSGKVHSLLLSSNHSVFYSASQDKSIRAWNFNSKSPGKTVNTIYGKIFCFVLTRDKKTVITGNDAGEARFFNVNRKEEEFHFNAHNKGIKCLELSPDDSCFASGSSDGEIKLWNVSSKQLLTFFPDSCTVNSLAFTEDGLYLISAGDDFKIKMWSINFKRLEHQFTEHQGIINQIKVVKGKLFSVSVDKTIKIWSLLNKKLENSIPNLVYAAACIDIHPNQKLAVWNDYNKIHVYDLEENHRVFTLEGHLREVIKSVIFSPNGKYVISASGDSSIKLWNIKNMCEKSKFVGSSYSILSLCTNADKKLIIAGTEDGWLIVWDSSGRFVMKFQEHQDTIWALAFSDKYQIIASAGKDKVIKTWDFRRRIVLKSLEGHSNTIRALVFDGDVLVSGAWDQTIKIWNFHSGSLVKELTGHTSSVTSLVMAGDSVLISGSYDKTIKVWDLLNFEETCSLPGSKSTVSSLAFDSSSGTFASGCQDSSINLWDFPSKSLKKTLSGHSKEISALVFIKSGEFLASASYDRTLKLWSLSDFTLKASCIAASSNIFGIIELYTESSDVVAGDSNKVGNLKNSNEFLAVAAGDKTLIIWDILPCRQKTALLWPLATPLVIRKHFDFFYVGMSSGAVCVFDAVSNKLCKVFAVSFAEINDLKVNCQGNFMAAGGNEKKFIMFNIQEERVVQSLSGHTNIINAVELTPDLKNGISGSSDSSIKVWNLKDNCEEFTLSGHRRPIQSLLFYSNNNWIISTSMDKNIKIWDIVERSEIKSLKSHTASVTCSTLIQNETLLATGSEDSSIKIWDFLNGKENFFLFGHTGKVVALCESDDQERLISAGVDCLVKIWDFKEKYEEFSFRAHSDSVTSLAIMGNQYLFTGSADKALKLWDLKNYSTSNRTLNLNLEDYDRENWTIKNTFDPYCQDKLIFYNIYENIRSDEYSFLSKTACQLSFSPYKFTILHVLCLLGKSEIIENLLTQPLQIRPDRFKRSPVYYAIIKKHQKCVDFILSYLCNSVNESKQLECFSSVYSLRNDFPIIVANSSVNLKDFLNVLLHTSPVYFSKVSVSLPLIQFSSALLPSLKEAPVLKSEEQVDEKTDNQVEEIPIQFTHSLFELPNQVGSKETINMLNSILECSDNQIFETQIIQNYIQFHWNSVKSWTAGYSLLLFGNLMLILVLIDESGPPGERNIDNWFYILLFVLVSFSLVAWEGIQIAMQKLDYFKDTWNLFDVLRISVTLIWLIFGSTWRLLVWLVIVTNFLRGLTGFRLFDGTRYYVRLILRSVNDTKFFLIMLSYSIITCGTMVMVSSPEPIVISFESVWMIPYKLNFGGYEIDQNASSLLSTVYIIATMINIIVMLNLLVSILGDSHDQFQIEKNIIDYKEKAILSQEIQQMMFWNWTISSNLFIHIMNSFASAGMRESWEGRMIYLEKKIERITYVFSENQTRFGEKINEKIMENKDFLEEKIQPIQESLVKIINSSDSGENVSNLIKLTQNDFDLKINNLGRKLETSHEEINTKVKELDEKINGIQTGIDRIMTILASNN